MRAAIVAALIAYAAAVPLDRPGSNDRWYDDGDYEDGQVTVDPDYVPQSTQSFGAGISTLQTESIATKTLTMQTLPIQTLPVKGTVEDETVELEDEASVEDTPAAVESSSSQFASPSAAAYGAVAPLTTMTAVSPTTIVDPPSPTGGDGTATGTGDLPFAYPDEGTPLQITLNGDGSGLNSEQLATVYTITDVDEAPQTHIRRTSTTEPACTAAPESYIEEALTGHNGYRAEHSANPVVWDDNLSCIAQRQADSCIWDHLTYVDGGGYGQNLAGASGIGDSISMWYNEESKFTSFYGQSNPGGDFEDYGHFTQLVWASTTSVGCATKECGSGNGDATYATGSLTVCNYYGSPAGNMEGAYDVNVLP